MKYDFVTEYDRKGRDAIAVDAFYQGMFTPDETITADQEDPRNQLTPLPMWVADMNFAAAPTIVKAIQERLEHPLFGYYGVRDEYLEGIIRWQTVRNKVKNLEKENIGYENGVLGGVIAAMNVIAGPGSKVLLNSPTYVGFTGVLENAGFKIVLSDMYLDTGNIWRLDYEDMEKKLRDEHIHCAVFCSPHNPTGRVWEREELEKVMELFKKYDVYVISDEIWSDIILGGRQHIPTQSVSDDARNRTFAFYAPTKTFSLAGFVGAYHIVYNQMLHDRIKKQSSLCSYNNMNLLSMYALMGAYAPEGAEWVDELRIVLTENMDYAYEYITKHFKGVHVSKAQGTYMMYLDCEEWCKEHGKTLDQLLQMGFDCRVIWQDGRPFHRPYAIRLNLALPHHLVVEAFDRLSKYVFTDRLFF